MYRVLYMYNILEAQKFYSILSFFFQILLQKVFIAPYCKTMAKIWIFTLNIFKLKQFSTLYYEGHHRETAGKVVGMSYKF